MQGRVAGISCLLVCQLGDNGSIGLGFGQWQSDALKQKGRPRGRPCSLNVLIMQLIRRLGIGRSGG